VARKLEKTDRKTVLFDFEPDSTETDQESAVNKHEHYFLQQLRDEIFQSKGNIQNTRDHVLMMITSDFAVKNLLKGRNPDDPEVRAKFRAKWWSRTLRVTSGITETPNKT
jgi:hypothetical protein